MLMIACLVLVTTMVLVLTKLVDLTASARLGLLVHAVKEISTNACQTLALKLELKIVYNLSIIISVTASRVTWVGTVKQR